MLNFTCNSDFSDVESAMSEFMQNVNRKINDVGSQAVEYAVDNGTYHDVTGTLRSNNKYSVDGKGLTLYNDTPYAEEVESRADVLASAAVFAEAELKKIFE